MPENTDGGRRMPKRPRTWTLPISLAVVAAGVWSAWAWNFLYWAERRAGQSSSYYAPAIRMCRLELGLRAAAVRRFAQRAGRLPASLTECAEDAVGIDDLAVWVQERRGSVTDDQELADLLSRFDRVVMEPWTDRRLLPDDGGESRRPGAELDLLGLPIVFQRGGRPAGDDSWVGSADPLPPAVERYLEASGGLPPPAPEPFALGSLYVRDCIEKLAPLQRKAQLAAILFPGGLAAILLTTLLVIWKAKMRRGPDHPVKTAGLGLAVVAGGAAFFGTVPTVVTCYLMEQFSTVGVRAEIRLELLERAVRRGQIADEVAAKSRAYLLKLDADRRGR